MLRRRYISIGLEQSLKRIEHFEAAIKADKEAKEAKRLAKLKAKQNRLLRKEKATAKNRARRARRAAKRAYEKAQAETTKMFTEKYDPVVFQSIQSLHDATKKFEERDGADFIEKKLKPLILKYDLAKEFGVSLVHRHFDMDESSVLVEKDSTTAPWKFATSFLKNTGGILPSSWTLKGNKVYPYEFRFVHPRTKLVSVEENLEFLKEFFELVYKRGLAGYIGLRRAPTDPKAFGEALECTEGKANIIFREGELPEEYLRTIETTPTMWFFHEGPPHETYRCACQKHGSSEIHSHNHIHSA